MLPERTWVCIAFSTALGSAKIRFVCGMNVRMLLAITGIGKTAIAPRKFAHERFFACVGALMNFQILRTCKRFAAVCERARERLLSSMNSYVVDKLILRFERLSSSMTLVPQANVSCTNLCSSHVLQGNMLH